MSARLMTAEPQRANQNGAAAPPSSKALAADLFKGVWVIDEEEEDGSVSGEGFSSEVRRYVLTSHLTNVCLYIRHSDAGAQGM
jgi:hypothetical protein